MLSSYPVEPRIHTSDRPVSFTMEAGSPTQRVEPITLEWAKQHLRFPFTREDTVLRTYLAAARAVFEEQTGRQAIDAVWEFSLDGIPCQRVIEVPRPPFSSIVSFTYLDADGNEQDVDATTYRVLPSALPEGSPADMVFDPYCPCGRIELVASASWPAVTDSARCLRIRRTCGYGPAATDMPDVLLNTLGHLAQYFFERGPGDLPKSAAFLLMPFQLSAMPTVTPLRWSSTR